MSTVEDATAAGSNVTEASRSAVSPAEEGTTSEATAQSFGSEQDIATVEGTGLTLTDEEAAPRGVASAEDSADAGGNARKGRSRSFRMAAATGEDAARNGRRRYRSDGRDHQCAREGISYHHGASGRAWAPQHSRRQEP